MTSYGKVLDLLDDRYLNIQDVVGNVVPFPTLVPYEQYVENMIVYRIDSNHEIYMGLLQDFTDRFARKEHKEVWTWCVQWEVEKLTQDAPVSPAVKKQRTEVQFKAARNAEPAKRKEPALTICERRTLHQELFQEDDILRILIDIVQVHSKLVPNFVEFLYQWIDYYEGGGSALKAALRKEIPSLWLYEYHPLPLFNEDSKDKEEDRLEKAAEKMGERLMRKKPPALDEIEKLTEQSERLEYQEVKFGIQRPIDPKDEPLPPLINIPHDYGKQRQYYAACYKNRQRAFWLLQEAGITGRQIANYKKLQSMSPKETPEDANGDGFFNYYRDESYAHWVFIDSQGTKELREKQKEVAISRRLAEEARVAAATSTSSSEGSMLPSALIPSTPAQPSRPATFAAFLAKLKGMTKQRDPTIKFVPRPMLGKVRSKVFARAVTCPSTDPLPHDISSQPLRDGDSSGEAMDDDDYSDFSDYSDDLDDDDDPDEDAMDPTPSAPPEPLPAAIPSVPQYDSPTDPAIPSFVRHLDSEQLTSLIPFLTPQAREAHPISDACSGATLEIVEWFLSSIRNSKSATNTDLKPDLTLASGTIYGSAFHIIDQYTGPSKQLRPLSQASNRAPPPPNIQPPQPDLPLPFSGISNQLPSLSPLANLANNLSLASPFALIPNGIPIQIYIPKIVLPQTAPTSLHSATDCLILGYTHPSTNVFSLSRAIFLPANIWDNILTRVRRNHAEVLETYAPPPNHPRFRTEKKQLKNPEDVRGPHRYVYEKLVQIFGMMTKSREGEEREEALTKRWKTGKGLMTERRRGVWVELGAEERRGPGCTVNQRLNENDKLSEGEAEKERRRREIDELLDEEEDEMEK
ncbi:hypothetical protein N0V90_008190 [Kalmusia sp. IMI 367209]|nr:hypothetical protein N0V90_008190 [Kalmusia sp. IMI 367209]